MFRKALDRISSGYRGAVTGGAVSLDASYTSKYRYNLLHGDFNSMLNRPRILHIINNLAPHGAQQFLVNFLSHADHRTFDYRVACIAEGGALQSEIEALGIHVFPFYRRHKTDLSTLFDLAAFIKDHNIDLVHTQLFTSDTWGRTAALLAGVRRSIVSVQTVTSWKKFYHIWVDRTLALSTHRIVAVSHAVKDFLIEREKLPAWKVCVIPNGVDVAQYRPRGIDVAAKKKELGMNPSNHVISCMARFYPAKDQISLMRGFSLALPDLDGVKLVLVGDGPLIDTAREEAFRLNITDRVLFLGNRRDIPELLEMSDLVVLPSIVEGLPLSLLEAMAAGKAVIATAVGGVPEMIDDGRTGMLVPVGDLNAWASSMRRVMKDESLRAALGTKAQQAVNRFDIRNIIKAYESLYGEALAN